MSHRVKYQGNSQVPVSCKQCGKCCVVLYHSEWAYCPYLIRYVTHSSCEPQTRCAIYKHRLYAIIGTKTVCLKREHNPFNYPGCPYNKPEWETHPKYKNR
jgi:hypothetical protein